MGELSQLLRPNSKEAQRKREDQTLLSQGRSDLWQMGMCGWLVLSVIYHTHLKNAVTLCRHLANVLPEPDDVRQEEGLQRVSDTQLFLHGGGKLLTSAYSHKPWWRTLA